MELRKETRTAAELENLIKLDIRRCMRRELCGLLDLVAGFPFDRCDNRPFNARDNFVLAGHDTPLETPGRIYDIGISFDEYFLGGSDGDGVIEEAGDGRMILYVHQIQRAASSADVLEYLRIANRPIDLSLSTLYLLISDQLCGLISPLLAEKEIKNICFPMDAGGNQRLGVFTRAELGWGLRSRPWPPDKDSFKDWPPGSLVFTEVSFSRRETLRLRSARKKRRQALRGKGL